MITKATIIEVFKEFKLEATSAHGYHHSRRVFTIGMKLAESTGADKLIVAVFALVHDIGREDEIDDPLHGERSASLLLTKFKNLFLLNTAQLKILFSAISRHHYGRITAHPTIGTCWDADRLDLGRCYMEVDPEYLSTAAAREPAFFNWATVLWEAQVKEINQ